MNLGSWEQELESVRPEPEIDFLAKPVPFELMKESVEDLTEQEGQQQQVAVYIPPKPPALDMLEDRPKKLRSYSCRNG